MSNQIVSDDLEAVGMEEIDCNKVDSESLVLANRDQVADSDVTWQSQTVEANDSNLNTGNSSEKIHIYNKLEGNLFNKESRVILERVKISEVFGQEIMEKSSVMEEENANQKVVDSNLPQNNSDLNKTDNNDPDYGEGDKEESSSEEDSDIEFEEIEVGKEIVILSSDTDSNDERPIRPKQKRENIGISGEELPSRSKRKRMPSRVVRENIGTLNEISDSNSFPDKGLRRSNRFPENGLCSWDSGDPAAGVGRLRSVESAVPKCDHGCFELSPEIFEEINSYFSALYESDQDAYLASLLKSKRVAMREFERNRPLLYTLKHKGLGLVVCRRAFLHAFQITSDRLIDVWTNYVKIQEEQFLVMRELLMKLPTLVPLSERDTRRLYFAPDLNLERLYALYYKVRRKGRYSKVVRKDCYRRVLKKYSNVRMVPKKNGQCHVCQRINRNIRKLSVLLGQEIPLTEEKANLKKHKDLARKDQEIVGLVLRRQDIENTLVLYIGKQQSHPIPSVPVDLNYYKRKLWTHYLGICDLKMKGTRKLYVWDEVTAKRGSIEVISCLNKWIEDNHDMEDNLVLFTDGIGRYRNINMLLYLLRQIHSRKFFKIDHYFLVPGNHVNPCSPLLSDIESALELQSTVASMEDFVGLIRDAVSKRDVEVILMERTDFLDYSALQPHVHEGTSDVITYRNARVVSFHCCHKDGYSAAEDYSGVNRSNPVRLMPGVRPFSLKAFNLVAVVIPLKYPNPIPLDPQKVSDLKDLLHCIMPYEKRSYLRMILVDQESLADGAVVEDPFEEEGGDNGLFDYV